MSRFTLIEARDRPGAPPPRLDLDRREALRLLTAGAALAMASCGRPREEIVPYVDQPEGLTPGVAQRYATTVNLNGYGRGVMAIAYEGRPTKLEGSPRHPASLGSTDVFAEAEVLNLYDPSRLKGAETREGPASWDGLETALAPRLAGLQARDGEGLTLVTPRITSPTELRLIAALQARHPKMRWRRFEAVNDDNVRAGARLAFARLLTVRPRLAETRVVLCLDADPLGPGPEQVANARAYASGRRPGAPISRWYAAEGGWTLTGANADHRLPLSPLAAGNLLLRISAAFGLAGAPAPLPPTASRFAEVCARDLRANAGRAVVLVGPAQPPEVHALAHWVNTRLNSPVDAIAPVDPNGEDHVQALSGLAADLHVGRVTDLIVLGGNPAYDAPDDLGMAAAIAAAPFSIHITERSNETSRLCRWRAPLSHTLESWGDIRAPDGTASLVQPLIRPLYDSRTGAEVLALLTGDPARAAHDLVRQTWAKVASGDSKPAAGAPDFEQAWRTALITGVIGSAPLATPPPPAKAPTLQPRQTGPGLLLALSPDPSVFDGRYAENAWLQECPKPITAEVWGASLAISPEDAQAHGLKDFDHVRLSAHGKIIVASVKIAPGQAPGVLSGFLGGGRTEAGPIGTGVGYDFASLRTAARPWLIPVDLAPAPGRGGATYFQAMHRLEGDARTLSPEVEVAALAGLGCRPVDGTAARPPSLLPTAEPYTPSWAMVIDAAVCIGCNACVVACQAENNVPVVGPHEVARGRDMHWLRIDAYDIGHGAETRPAFQPVPCMQCEHAPCEPVCPVEASVHDHEGLNDQVYNRCIGTRFCQSNCPYKVRRFNWYGYSHDQAYGNLGEESLKAQKNPEVTVRARGVMEKCTYCVQRISAARREAEKEDRPIGPHEVVTACQSACPTQALSFGDMTDPGSGVAAQRKDPRHYALLGELGTRPRTTYLARLRNPNPELGPPREGSA